MLIEYVPWKPAESSQEIVRRANVIIEDLQSQGHDLTLRQLYYQFVSKGWLPNKQSEYKRLGDIVNKARLAGMISWTSLVDRTRHLHLLNSWDDETEIIQYAAEGEGHFGFRTDRWARQPVRMEVWIEKEAFAGVFERICDELHVPFFAWRLPEPVECVAGFEAAQAARPGTPEGGGPPLRRSRSERDGYDQRHPDPAVPVRGGHGTPPDGPQHGPGRGVRSSTQPGQDE